jgi:hypothetical protein
MTLTVSSCVLESIQGIRGAAMEAFMFGVFAIIVVLSSIRLAMRMQD